MCEFPTLLDIPRCYREVWAAAVGKVMTAIQENEVGIQLERGLKWFLIHPKALFRQGKRGGKAGKGLIAQLTLVNWSSCKEVWVVKRKTWCAMVTGMFH